MMYPETKRGMGASSLLQICNNEPLSATDKSNISRARFILKHAPEEGKHAAESGMDLKAYAEASGKARQTLQYKLYAYLILAAVPHVRHETIRDSWRNLAELHAAPDWLWSALVEAMVASGWTVAVTREKVGAFKDVADPPPGLPATKELVLCNTNEFNHLHTKWSCFFVASV